MDSLPVASHSFYGKKKTEPWPRSAEDIATLAKFRMVVIEKFEGPCWDQCYIHPVKDACNPSCNVEQYITGTAKALKDANPKISVILYLNSMLNFPFYGLTGKYFDEPELLLHDKHGKIGTLQNDAGLGNLTVPDFSQQRARDMWLDEIKNATSTGLFDGVFADKAVKNGNSDKICNHGCIELTHDVAMAWEAGHLQNIRDGQKQLGEGLMMRKAGSLEEGETDATVYAEWNSPPNEDNLQKVRDMRQQVTGYVFAYVGKKCTEDDVAAFLMVMEEKVFFQCEKWMDIYMNPLGKPTGPASKKGTTYSRSFASGTTATWDHKSGKGTISWANTVVV